MLAVRKALEWVEQGRIPDIVVRKGIRTLLGQRLAELQAGGAAGAAERSEQFMAAMGQAPIALLPGLANEQHYELPAEFFAAVLGPHRKYSCCFFAGGQETLEQAEVAALRVTCERAGLADGQQILELGCGWGSLTMWMAAQYPRSQITAVSNSHSQREYIEGQARSRGLANLRVVTCDMNEFSPEQRFDRIVSVEMFEHMRNWQTLFARLSTWLREDGRFLMHVFCHRGVPYAFESKDESDWMSQHFFSGGMMPSDDLPLRFQDHLRLETRWRWDGTHYERTANAWLANMDAKREQIWPLLERVYGAQEAPRWWSRWRMFFMACAELWGYEQGQQWWVSHYLFSRHPQVAA